MLALSRGDTQVLDDVHPHIRDVVREKVMMYGSVFPRILLFLRGSPLSVGMTQKSRHGVSQTPSGDICVKMHYHLIYLLALKKAGI